MKERGHVSQCTDVFLIVLQDKGGLWDSDLHQIRLYEQKCHQTFPLNIFHPSLSKLLILLIVELIFLVCKVICPQIINQMIKQFVHGQALFVREEYGNILPPLLYRPRHECIHIYSK